MSSRQQPDIDQGQGFYTTETGSATIRAFCTGNQQLIINQRAAVQKVADWAWAQGLSAV